MRSAVLSVLLCGATLPAVAQDVSAVTQASQAFTTAMSGGDASAASALFAEDATVLPPGGKELSGKSQIQMFLNGMTRSVENLRYTSEGVKPVGDNGAREIGSFSFKTKGRNGKEAQEVSGKYLLVWQKVGSDWKIAADMWNRGNAQQGQGGKKGKGTNGGQGTGAGTE